MRFTRDGFLFQYHGDTILRRWPKFPWSGSNSNKTGKFHSSLYSRDFSNFAEYWGYAGVVDSLIVRSPVKLQGYSWQNLLGAWVKILYPGEYVVVLVNINASAKGIAFWSRIPKANIEKLLKDVVVLRCNKPSEVWQLVESVTPEFAEAYGFSPNGKVISNLDKENTE